MSKNWKIWIIVAGLLLITNIAMTEWYWPSKVDQAYERGKIDGQFLVLEKWGHYSDETVEQLVDCMHLRAIYVFDSLSSYADSTDTITWYGWDITAALAQGWYDRAADTSHSVYEDAFQAWAMSVLTKERQFVIYFDSVESSFMIYEADMVPAVDSATKKEE